MATRWEQPEAPVPAARSPAAQLMLPRSPRSPAASLPQIAVHSPAALPSLASLAPSPGAWQGSLARLAVPTPRTVALGSSVGSGVVGVASPSSSSAAKVNDAVVSFLGASAGAASSSIGAGGGGGGGGGGAGDGDSLSTDGTEELTHLSSFWLSRRLSTKHLSRHFSRYIYPYYLAWYAGYLCLVITCGALLMLCLDSTLGLVDSFFLAISAATMTGLSSVDFVQCNGYTHAIVLCLIVSCSPMLMSVMPVILRLRFLLRAQSKRDQRRRLGGWAFFGLLTTANDEGLVLRSICMFVLGYWLVAQTVGWLMLWLLLHNGGYKGAGPWPALFLAVSAFHNAGLVTLPDGLPLDDTFLSGVLLAVVMLLVLVGNTCFPILLRVIIAKVQQSSCVSGKTRRVLGLLLKHPRTCYTHLFPDYATKWLAVVTPLLVLLQIGSLLLVDLWVLPQGRGEQMLNGLSVGERGLAIAFQSVVTRTAGFSVVNLELISPTSAFVFCVCMWISVCPVVVVMRSTVRSPERVVSEYHLGQGGGDQQSMDKLHTTQELTNFMSQNSCYLMGFFFLILIAEEYSTSREDVRDRRFLYIVFEFCSAYGTVGLSMSGGTYSRSGDWAPLAKLTLMAVMFMGRLRGLPESIDPTLQMRETSEDQLSEVAASFSAPPFVTRVTTNELRGALAEESELTAGDDSADSSGESSVST